MQTTRLIGLALIVVGFAVPSAIDAYESANYLDIPRDVGVLPWVMMAVAGIIMILASFRTRKK